MLRAGRIMHAVASFARKKAVRPARLPLIRTISGSRRVSDDVKITFVTAEGTKIEAPAKIGDTLLDVTVKNEIDEVEGACEGTLACSTCHMIFEPEVFETLPALEEEEEDMLDLAIGVEDTSRLGCQIKVTAEMDGMEIRLPADEN